ncbi:hypothetical protein ACHAWT_004652 [Skeletonema menzelii]
MAAQLNNSLRGPHPDLPTITEDLLESEDEENSIISDKHIIIDDNQSDSGSKVSYANSYAFTLDGVGFDEENSLISGICNGSVVNHHSSEQQQQHNSLTSPQNKNSRGVKSKSQRLENHHRHYTEEELQQQHRDACRKLGIPWSSANSDSDFGGSDIHDGGTKTANTAIKKMKWPSWPDKGGKNFSIAATPPTLDTLDEHMRNYALSNTDGAKKRRKIDRSSSSSSSSRWNGSTLIATIVLIAICIIGIMVTALTSKSDQVEAEVVIMEGHPRPMVPTTTTNTVGDSLEAGAHNTKAAKEDDASTTHLADEETAESADSIAKVFNHKLSQTCLLKYQVNSPTSTTPVNTITFELICEGEAWIGIGFSNDGQMIGSEAVLGVPGEIPQKYVLGGKDNSSVVPMAAEKQTLMDASIQVTRRGLTVMRFTKIMKEDDEVEIKSGGENTFLYAQGMGVDLGYHATGESFTLTLPDIEETESQDNAEAIATIEEPIIEDTPPSKEAADGLDSSSCMDQPGKFRTRKNKYRSCEWMSKSGDALHSNLHDRECGMQALNTQPSELGLKCRYTCRAYNGCLVQDTQDVPIEVENVQPPPIDVLPIAEGAVAEDIHPPPIEVLPVAEGAPAVAAPCTIDVCNLELSHTCLLKYQVNTPTSITPVNTITFELICEGEAWIGIGFSNDGQMIGSEAVLGVPGGIPQKYVLGGKDNSSVMPMAAHKQTLMDASVEYESDLTILKFTKIMKEDDEVEIKSGGENTFLYAQGMGVDLGYHVTGESFTLSLPSVDVETAATSIESSTETTLEGDTFIDASNGLLRSCSWLDIRDLEQRQKRRDANCHDELTQASCPTSCSAYSFVNQVQSGENPQDIIESIINKPQDIKLMYAHVPLPRDDCFDSDGFFLDSNSTVRQCDWLNTNPDPLDETRKIYNCGYMDEPTDLGRMCKLSCGMCDW